MESFLAFYRDTPQQHQVKSVTDRRKNYTYDKKHQEMCLEEANGVTSPLNTKKSTQGQ